MSSKQGGIVSLSDLKLILSLFTRNWYWFVIGLFLSGTLAYFYTYRLANIYAARTQILLESNEAGKAAGLMFNTNAYSSYENVASQKRVLKSSNLIEGVIDQMNLYVSYFIVGRIKTTEVYQNMPFKVSMEHEVPNVYGVDFHLTIKDTSGFKLRYSIDEEEIIKDYNFDEIIGDNGLFFKIKKSPNLNQDRAESAKEIHYLFKFRHKYDLINHYKNAISVESFEWTSILNIKLIDEIPERAVRFLEVLTKDYIESTTKNRVSVNKNTLKYIDNQVSEVVGIINQIESQMENYKEAKSILDIEREESEYYRRLIKLEEQSQQIRLKLSSVEDLSEYILTNNDENFLPPSFYVLNDDQFLQNSINSLYELQTKRHVILQKGTEAALPISVVDKRITNLKSELIKYLENSKKYIEENLANVQNEIDDYQLLLKTVPENQRELLNIERKLIVNETMYSFLLQRRAENIISQAGIVAETEVIETPRPTGVVGPDKKKTFVYFLTSGFLFALIIAIIRSLFFDKIESVAELSAITDIKIISSIPFSQKASSDYLVVNADTKGFVTESFRSLRTNLQFLLPNKKTKIIMNTSIHPTEGKTFCSINLATILAKADKKVLLFDFDLHKPKVHKGLNMEIKKGVSAYLIDQVTEEEILLKTEIENLDVILAGHPPPNASELMMSDRVDKLIDYFQGKYEYIILDTPPIGVISDGIILMNKVDVTIFVMNVKLASRKGVRYLEELSSKVNIENCAILLNGVKPQRWKYYYGGYGYGYGYGSEYGYGYGYEADEEV